MQCPSCGKADLIHDTRDVPHTYKGQSTVIPSVTARFCPECTEFVLTGDEVRHFSEWMVEFDKRVNQTLAILHKWNLDPPNNHLIARIELFPGRDQIIVAACSTRIGRVMIHAVEELSEIVCVSTVRDGWGVSENLLSCPKGSVSELWILKPAGWLGEIAIDSWS